MLKPKAIETNEIKTKGNELKVIEHNSIEIFIYFLKSFVEHYNYRIYNIKIYAIYKSLHSFCLEY